MEQQYAGICKICKKNIPLDPVSGWRIFMDILVCRHHKGVEEWWQEMFRKEVDRQISAQTGGDRNESI